MEKCYLWSYGTIFNKDNKELVENELNYNPYSCKVEVENGLACSNYGICLKLETLENLKKANLKGEDAYFMYYEIPFDENLKKCCEIKNEEIEGLFMEDFYDDYYPFGENPTSFTVNKDGNILNLPFIFSQPESEMEL